MKKGIIRQIPLQADLCLNKQKVDIEDFKGWNKCNAPVYGNCLSPLYKNQGTHHDIFIGNDTYDFVEGVLKKNGTEVLSGAGSKKIKKTKITEDYSSVAVASDNVLTWVKELSGSSFSYSLHGSASTEVTLQNCQRIVSTKAFDRHNLLMYGIVVLYLRTDAAYGYYIAWSDNGTVRSTNGADDPTVYTDFNVISPLIQVAVFAQSKFMVSFFGSSGASLSETDVKNVYIEGSAVYDNPDFHDGTVTPLRYKVHDGDFKINAKINTSFYHTEYRDYTYVQIGMKQELILEISKHATDVEIELLSNDPDNARTLETFSIPANMSTDVVYKRTVYYWDYITSDSGGTQTPNYRYKLEITGENTVDTSGTGLIVPDSIDFSTAEYIKTLPCYIRENYWYTDEIRRGKSDKNICGRFRCKTVTNIDDTDAPVNGWSEWKDFGGYGYNGLEIKNYWGAKTLNGVEPTADYWSYADAIDYLDNASIVLNNWNTNCCYAAGFWAYRYIGSEGNWERDCKCNPIWFNANANPTTTLLYGEGYYNFSYKNSKYVYGFYQYKTAYTENALKTVDCCFDDGNLYCVGAITTDTETPLPTKLFSLSGTFDSFTVGTKTIEYTTSTSFDIQYDYYDENNVYIKYYVGMNISLSNNYLRIVYQFKAKKDDKEEDYINVLVDCLGIAEGEKAAHLYAGINSKTGGNVQGGVKNSTATEGFRMLFNNNLMSNIACYEQKDYIGTIIADWFTIDDTFCPAFSATQLYYKDINNHIWKVELVSNNADWDYKFIENRYIVLNTVNYFNCYDTKTGLKRHWASDYNNRIIFGFPFEEYEADTQFKSLLETEKFSGLLITGQNANYEETKDSITGIEIGAIYYNKVLRDYMSFISCNVPYGAVEGIDMYRGDDNSTSALYICSFQNGLKYIDNDLVNPAAIYPISENGDIRFNPNLFTQFISSYNNKDMVISDGIAYKLLYFNNVIPIMAYYMLDGVEELENAFVLQSSYYGVSSTRLYQMNYTNGVGVEVVCDITNLEYLGALPTQALFWSAQNRAIYTFKGNCIMQLSQYANDLTVIKGKWYNPATQELFLDTNIGLLVFSDLGTYCLEKENEYENSDIKDIFFFPDRFLINLKINTTTTFYFSYNNLEDYTSNKIKLITKYYGNAKTPITINNVYVRLFNQNVINATGDIVFKAHTVTDIGVHTDTKTVNIGGETGEQWDSETDTMLVKYTPQYNRGLGVALEIETTFPIIDIKYDYVDEVSTESQVAHINI